jgi:hypothetical protein
MKKLTVVVLAVFLLAGCATMTRLMGGYVERPYIGMPEGDFRRSAPLAYHVNETVTKYGTSRQYVFQDHVRPKYVYFDNGILTAMQNR